jgi:hypothetical protein
VHDNAGDHGAGLRELARDEYLRLQRGVVRLRVGRRRQGAEEVFEAQGRAVAARLRVSRGGGVWVDHGGAMSAGEERALEGGSI